MRILLSLIISLFLSLLSNPQSLLEWLLLGFSVTKRWIDSKQGLFPIFAVHADTCPRNLQDPPRVLAKQNANFNRLRKRPNPEMWSSHRPKRDPQSIKSASLSPYFVRFQAMHPALVQALLLLLQLLLPSGRWVRDLHGFRWSGTGRLHLGNIWGWFTNTNVRATQLEDFCAWKWQAWLIFFWRIHFSFKNG